MRLSDEAKADRAQRAPLMGLVLLAESEQAAVEGAESVVAAVMVAAAGRAVLVFLA